MRIISLILLSNALSIADAFLQPSSSRFPFTFCAFAEPKNSNNIPPRRVSTNDDPAFLSQDSGGFTVKQRLREEVESPFRKGSAITALYFSFLNTIKALQGGYSDAQPLDEALTNDAINIAGAIVCGLLAFREYKAGQSNLERIAQGGRLASLVLELGGGKGRKRVADFRRFSRVVVAAGGEEYVSRLCRGLTADQMRDSNLIPQKLEECDILVVPVLLEKSSSSNCKVGDTKNFWQSIQPEEGDRNMDISRAENVLAYPLDNAAWETYLRSEIETAISQGFDVHDKGCFLIVKKNGRIMKRATGIPPWLDLIATMEVADGSQFGMPGDTERYGGR